MNFLGLTHPLCSSLAEQSGWGCPQRCFPSILDMGAMASPELSAQSPELRNPWGYLRMQVKLTALWLRQTLRGTGLTLGHCTAPGEAGEVPFPLSGISWGLGSKGWQGVCRRDPLRNAGPEISARQFPSHVPCLFELGHLHLIRAEFSSKKLVLE